MPHSFQKEIDSFSKLLDTAAINTSSYSNYCKNYLTHLIDNKGYYLKIYADVFKLVLKNSHHAKENLTILDYGAGNGLMGIFAKFCGFGEVIINEIDMEFLEAAMSLSQDLNVPIGQFIKGDIKAVKQECFTVPDAIIATDVIEHVYDLDDFFSELRAINNKMVSVFTTGSNPENHLKVIKLRKQQLKDEHEGGSPDDFLLFGNQAHESYYNIRRRIIKSKLQKEPDSLIDTIASLTRGKNKKDILISIENFIQTQQLPKTPADKYNTCHPETGSWTERIISLENYGVMYKKAGFQIHVEPGYYNSCNKGLKSFMMRLLQPFIRIFGIKLAPFIFISGKPVDR